MSTIDYNSESEPLALGASPAEANDSVWRFVTRQPILDRLGRVHAYSLLARPGRGHMLTQVDRNEASRELIDNSVLFGIDQLTHGASAFIPCTFENITNQIVDLLPVDTSILQLQFDAPPSAEIFDHCRKLKAIGFRFALTITAITPELEPLVSIADYLRIDFTTTTQIERKQINRMAQRLTAALVAVRIETQPQYLAACQEGFALFQGYYFCHPTQLANRKVPANKMALLRILELLQRPNVSQQEIAHWVSQDASLTYRLLRLVNSPRNAVRQEVRSIDTALVLVGEELFRRLVAMAVSSDLNTSGSAELLRMAYVRARFCEQAGSHCGLDGTEQYLLGLLSLLPAMLSVPMDTLTPQLPLREAIREALHGTANHERGPLTWLEAHEKGDWQAASDLAIACSAPLNDILRIYGDAVAWAEDALSVLL